MWCLNHLAVRRAGARALRLLPGDDIPMEALDGLVIGGGDDISAELYGKSIELDVRLDPERDRLEMACLEFAAEKELPVLGICRGAQMINVFHGGTLHTDIHEVYETAPRRRTILPRKWVNTRPGSRLHEILDCERCRVNSLHHQSVESPGRDLRIVCEDEHGVVQGIERPGPGFLIGVQWHPEFLLFDRGQQRLFRRLVDAARDARAGD